MYYFLGIAIIILGLFLTFYYRLKPVHKLICKGITSLCFVVLAILAYLLNKEAESYFALLMIGILFGFLGDIALGVKEVNLGNKIKWMIFGISLFFIGHVFYIITILFIKLLKFNFGRLKVLVYSYTFISSVFLVICALNALYDPSSFKIIIAVGASSFVGSDYVLSFIYFKKINNWKKLIRRLNLTLYYCGQFLLALSIFLY